ncbi:helix-turn-helix domain-containing protein [Agilicoccus flavus]|uniref:helix-turn-helix domain-containing protein n=1 Tax=Agilicoccus flavus TaxID=2775968 RepID=UPI001CF6AC6D|nr:helix-turn-helix domain-containing protein [Agilicoccus flavus]
MATFTGRVRSGQELGDAIRQGREIHGWSQRELAARLGVTQKWLWELEQGKPGLLMERLFAALRLVDVSLLAEFEDPTHDLRPSPDRPRSDGAQDTA